MSSFDEASVAVGPLAAQNKKVCANSKLRALLSRRPVRSVESYPLTAAPTTLSITNGTTQPANTDSYRIATFAGDLTSIFTVYGGVKEDYAGGWRAKPVTVPAGFPQQYFAQRFAFMTDAETIYSLVVSSPASGYRVFVDGEAVSLSYTVVANGGFNQLVIDFGGVAKWRRIDIECSSDGAFGGVYIPNGRTVRKVDTSTRYRIGCVGDSTSASTNAGGMPDGWNVFAGKLLGGMDFDVVQIALGSTGILSSGQYHNAMAHIGDLVAQPLDEVWIPMGINDAVRGAASFTGSISGDVLTVSAITAGHSLRMGPGGVITGAGVASGTEIVRSLTGTVGGVGTYRLNNSQTVASAAMTGTAVLAADITTAYLGYFQAARTLCPFVPVMVGGVSRGDTAAAVETETAIKAAFDLWADDNSVFVPHQISVPKLYRGNNTDPTGNARFYFNTTDNVHEKKEGHWYRAGYWAEARRAARFPWENALAA